MVTENVPKLVDEDGEDVQNHKSRRKRELKHLTLPKNRSINFD